jgi:ParB family chromosome partitioning protein
MANKFSQLAENKISERKIIHSETSNDELFINKDSKKSILDLNISEVKDNPYQPRKFFDDEKQKELTESIKTYGQLNPILVHKTENGEYFLVAGERRLKACTSLGQTTIKAILIDADPEIVALIDNIQREDLHPIERAFAVNKLYEKYDKDKNKVAEVISTSVRTVERLLKLSSLKDKIICANGESADTVLTQNKIPLREFYGLLKYEEPNELNKHFKSLNRKFSKDVEPTPIQKKKPKTDITIANGLADKLLKTTLKLNKSHELKELYAKIEKIKEEIENLISR